VWSTMWKRGQRCGGIATAAGVEPVLGGATMVLPALWSVVEEEAAQKDDTTSTPRGIPHNLALRACSLCAGVVTTPGGSSGCNGVLHAIVQQPPEKMHHVTNPPVQCSSTVGGQQEQVRGVRALMLLLQSWGLARV
jgi:hypothetical protein